MKFYYTILANTFFYLGDFASKPLQWDWLHEEDPVSECLAGCVYSVYNWLMLKSVYFNDLGDCGVWRDYNEHLDLDPEDDKFEHQIYSKKDENNL